jgi:DNA-binding transcriptional LysR family regulator
MDYSLFVPDGMVAAAGGQAAGARILAAVPLAVLEGEGSFRSGLAAIARRKRLRLRIDVECVSFPLVARAVESGSVGGILPSIAAVDLNRLKAKAVEVAELDSLGREICLAWNPRVLRIRTALERAKGVLGEVLAI